ncbi:MAG: elongation factor P [Acidobacteriota bacterium]
MVNASDLRAGMVILIDNEPFRVMGAEFHIGQGKMPGSVHAKLRDVLKGTTKELRFRPEERLEDTALEKQEMEFLYSDAESATFMNPQSFEQVSIPLETVGPGFAFLKTEMMVPIEFYNGRPVSVFLPESVELTVQTTAPPIHQQQDSTYKSATLENGMEVMVPQFIAPGETVRIDVTTGKYLERLRKDTRKY